MCFVAFHADGRQRAYRAYIFAGSAAYAGRLVDGRYRGRQVVVGVRGHHRDGTGGAVACAVAAFLLTLGRQTFLCDHDGMANLYARLLHLVNELDGTRGTYF